MQTHAQEIEVQLSSVSKQLSHGNIVAAEQTLGALGMLRPDCALLVLDRARLQAAKGEEAADATFMHYATLKPRDAKGWAYFARFLLAQGEYQRADAAAGVATECDPGDPLAVAVQGQILDLKGDSQEGIKLLEQAVRLNPDDAEARFQLGSIHDRAKHPMEAVRDLRSCRDYPSDARAWDYLALNLESLGEIDRAQNAYQRCLAENRAGAYFDAFGPKQSRLIPDEAQPAIGEQGTTGQGSGADAGGARSMVRARTSECADEELPAGAQRRRKSRQVLSLGTLRWLSPTCKSMCCWKRFTLIWAR